MHACQGNTLYQTRPSTRACRLANLPGARPGLRADMASTAWLSGLLACWMVACLAQPENHTFPVGGAAVWRGAEHVKLSAYGAGI